MSETKPLRLYSKSSVSVDWKCPRAYFWNYVWNGTGLQGSQTSLELFMGNAVHDSMAAIALSHPSVDIDNIAQTAFKQVVDALSQIVSGDPDGKEFVLEQATLLEGMIRGFYKQVWPGFMRLYPKIKLIEQPMIYKHDGLGFMSKPDLVLEDRDGANWYIEYKTTSSKKSEWINSWNTAVQVHSTIKAIEDFLKEPVAGVIIQGLYKGYESYGKQSSPFCYAYKRSGNPPFTHDQVEYTYKAGFKRYPTWELPGGVRAWVESMPMNVLADQFPQTPPIFVNDELIQAFFRQQVIRQDMVVTAVENGLMKADMDEVFPQKFEACWPGWGNPCQYVKLCHSNAGLNPLANGFDVRNEDHQQIFRDLIEKEEDLSATMV